MYGVWGVRRRKGVYACGPEGSENSASLVSMAGGSLFAQGTAEESLRSRTS